MEDTQLYRTLEAAAMVGITSEEPKNVRYLFMRIVKAMSLSPTYEKTREGKGGKPEKFWTAEQIDAIKEYYNAHRKNSSLSSEEPTDEVKGTYVNLTGKPANDVVADELNAQATKSPSPTEPTNDAQTPAVADSETDTAPNSQVEPALDSIRQLVHNIIQTGDTSALQALRVSLCKLLQITDAELDKQKCECTQHPQSSL